MQLLKDVCSLDQILKFVIIANCKNTGTWNILEIFKVKNCPQSPMLYPFMNKYQFNQLTNTSTPSLSFNLFSCFVVSCRKGNVKTPKSLWPDTLGMTLYLKGASLQKTMMIVPFEKKKKRQKCTNNKPNLWLSNYVEGQIQNYVNVVTDSHKQII